MAENKETTSVNLTPHNIVLVDEKGNSIKEFPTEGSVRLSSHTIKAGVLFLHRSSGRTIHCYSGWFFRGGEAPPVSGEKCSECGADPGNGAAGYSACCGAEEVQASSDEMNWDIIPLTETVFGEVEGLPEYKKGTYYIVSSLVAQACPDRSDLLIVNETVRDEQGRICGCKSFSVNPFLSSGGGKNE